MVMPLGRPGANYRDELPKPTPPDAKPDPLEDTAYEPIFFSTIMGFPQLVVPSEFRLTSLPILQDAYLSNSWPEWFPVKELWK